MFGLDFLDLIIGLFLVYFVFAVIASAFTEVVAGYTGMRAKNLVAGIKIMLQGDEGALDAFYSHPAIAALAPPGKKPSYIPAEVVARVYTSLTHIESGAVALIGDSTRASISRALEAYVGPEVDQLKAFFNNTMDRAIGWYKRKTQYIVIGVALLVVVVSNADTIMMVNTLWQDPTARDQLVALAERQPPPDATVSSEAALRDSVETRNSLANLSILGWEKQKHDVDNPREVPDTFWGWVSKVIGLGITVGAVSMGAPFWYAMLGNLLKARAALTGEKPDGDSGGTQSAAA
jgi:hypothetical protein